MVKILLFIYLCLIYQDRVVIWELHPASSDKVVRGPWVPRQGRVFLFLPCVSGQGQVLSQACLHYVNLGGGQGFYLRISCLPRQEYFIGLCLMQAAMSCETLVCMGSQIASRHKPKTYSCPGKQDIRKSNPCPPQGSHNLSRRWPSTCPCPDTQGRNKNTRPCLCTQGPRTTLALTVHRNTCKGKQVTGRSLPDDHGCNPQITSRSKPKVNFNIEEMASAGKGTTKQTTKPIKSKSSRATPTKLPGKNPARAIPTAPARKNQVKRISAGTNSTQKIRSASGIKLDNNNVKTTGPSTRREENIQKTCVGWCMQFIQDSLEKTNISMVNFGNIKENPEQEKRFAKIRSAVKSDPYYLVRVGANLYADKNEYNDRTINKLRAQMFHKNVLRVASDVFYPYTRSAIRKAIISSGHVYLPSNRHYLGAKPLQKRDGSSFPLISNDKIFTNRYFDRNPLLHGKEKPSKRHRKSSSLPIDDDYLNDPYNIGKKHYEVNIEVNSNDGVDESYRRENSMDIKPTKLNDFINTDKTKRSKGSMPPSQVKHVLGVPLEETILEHPHNTVDDIIGGMNLRSKGNTLLIGGTKKARTKINNWVRTKNRSQKLPNSSNVGIVVKGKSRARAIDVMLKSMVQNYQYADNIPIYKKMSANDS